MEAFVKRGDLDALVMFPEGTKGAAEEKELVTQLLAACDRHGYGRTRISVGFADRGYLETSGEVECLSGRQASSLGDA